MDGLTDWYWVRHAPTHAKVMVGHTDLAADLSDRQALARLSAALPAAGVLVASDLRRAAATADAIGDTSATAGNPAPERRTRLPDVARFREFHYGAWEGLGWREIAARDPDLSRRFWEAPGDIAPPGGESWNQVSGRVDAAVADLVQRWPDRPMIVVAHFGVILTRIALALGMTPAAALTQDVAPLSVTRLRPAGKGWRAVTVNQRV